MNNKHYNNCNKLRQVNNFVQKKENAICSLYEVENFLCNFSKFIKAIKIYNIFR